MNAITEGTTPLIESAKYVHTMCIKASVLQGVDLNKLKNPFRQCFEFCVSVLSCVPSCTLDK